MHKHKASPSGEMESNAALGEYSAGSRVIDDPHPRERLGWTLQYYVTRGFWSWKCLLMMSVVCGLGKNGRRHTEPTTPTHSRVATCVLSAISTCRADTMQKTMWRHTRHKYCGIEDATDLGIRCDALHAFGNWIHIAWRNTAEESLQ